MSNTIFKDVWVWDGEKDDRYLANVKIVGNKISKISTNSLEESGDKVINGRDNTLMCGLVDGHCHPSFTDIALPTDLGFICPEEHMLLVVKNLKILLDHGFTSIFEAASAKPMLGVVARNAIDSGLIIGPRMRAGSPEITVTGGLGDERRRHIYQESFGLIADGVDGMTEVVRTCIRDGVDTIKINISGDEFVSHSRAEITPMLDEEVAAAVKIAHRYHKKVASHSRSPESVKQAVRNGVDCIYHCDFADEEAIDMLDSVKDNIFVGPAFGLVHNCTKEGDIVGIPKEQAESMGLFRKFDKCCEVYHKIRKRGIRVVVGGDYGFAVTPMGQNARDIEHFVTYFGYSPIQALKCATVIGQQLMGADDVLGKVKEGYLADLLLVKGDPTKDVALLQKQENLLAIMKDGKFHKEPTV